MKLLMITGDRALAQGKKGPFYYMLEEFSKHWERVDIICPKISNFKFQISNQIQNSNVKKVHGNVFVHASSKSLWRQPWFILKKGLEIYKEQKFDLFTVHSYPPFYNDIGGRWLYNKIFNFPRPRCGKAAGGQFTIFNKFSNSNFQTPPYILEVMHISGHPRAGSFKEWLYKILTGLFVRWSAKKAKAVRVINKKQAPDFLKKHGVDEKKTKHIPAFYIDLEVFRPQEVEKKYDIVFSGRLVKNKGIFLLLEAIKNQKLIIVGTGPLEKKIKKYIKNHKLEKNVELAGWLPSTEDVARIYNQSKILVMPSLSEGGPRVTLEAMACRVPVITTKVGLMIDIIQDGENGIFIDWNSQDIAKKIFTTLNVVNSDLREKIAENGYKTAQKFERKKAIKNYAYLILKTIQ